MPDTDEVKITEPPPRLRMCLITSPAASVAEVTLSAIANL